LQRPQIRNLLELPISGRCEQRFMLDEPRTGRLGEATLPIKIASKRPSKVSYTKVSQQNQQSTYEHANINCSATGDVNNVTISRIR